LSFEVLLAVLLGAALHASWNALVKSGSDPLLDIVLITAVMFFPLPRPDSWGYLAASVLIHQAYFGLLALAYQGGELSLVYPIMRGTAPAFTALAALAVLGEQPSPGEWTGIMLVSGGVWLLAADTAGPKNVRLTPVIYALLNAGVIAIGTLVDGFGARLSGNAFSYTGWMLLLTGIIIFTGSIGWRRGPVARHVRNKWKTGVVGGACTFASYSLALWAMTHAPIALVAALRETSIVFTGLAALFVLKERFSPLRCISIAVVVAGAVAIKVF
jgi:drug/metabolite transporter (DMT)-like permease